MVAAIETNECAKSRKEKRDSLEHLSEVAQEDVLKSMSPSESLCYVTTTERDIQEVKIETETRAIVFAKMKNNTPPPEGSIPTEHDKKWRAEGERYKYLIEKTQDGWKISQVYKFDKFADLQKRDVWEKVYQVQLTPSYPSLVDSRQ